MGIIIQPYEDTQNNSIGIKHYEDTVINNVNWDCVNSDDLEDFLKRNNVNEKLKNLNIWGVEINNATNIVKDKAKVGDIVYFTCKGKVTAEATLYSEIIDTPIFDCLWDKTKDMIEQKVVYNRIYLIKNIKKVTPYPSSRITNYNSDTIRKMTYI